MGETQRQKIPAECKTCGDPLSMGEMDEWIAACEKRGRDPMMAMEGPVPGINCRKCRARRLADAFDDPTNPNHEFAKRLVSRARRNALGLRVVRGGK